MQAKISEKAATNRRTVIFKADQGFFQGGKGDSIAVEADKFFIAKAQVSSLRVGLITVTAKIQGIKAESSKTITFDKSFPSAIAVSVDSFATAIDYKDEVVLTATLSTDNGGKPSIGHEVRFEVVRADNQIPIGDFVNNKSVSKTDADGKARIRYTPGVTTYQGYVQIRAITRKADNTDLPPASTRIYVIKKP